MLVQPLRTPDLRIAPHGEPAEPRVAVLVNANARRVTERVIRSLSHVVPEEDLLVSRSEVDARRIAQTVLERQYHTVFCGGGDGTFMGFVHEIARQAELRGRRGALPRFGVLRLGTGNGIASLVNASSLKGEGLLDDVLRARANEVPGYRRLDLLQVDGRRTHFAGLGVDGKLLNDYISVKETLGRGALGFLGSGPGGYFLSVTLKTIPHYLLHSTLVECEVVNGKSGRAYRLGPDGSTVEEIPPGGLLYSGRLMMAAASTIPYYGFELTMFPFAGRRRRMMHVRLGAVRAPEVLANLGQFWKGKWFPPGKVLDFHTAEVDIRFARPMPFQLGGDAAGYRERVRFTMAPEQVELVDFNGAVEG